MRTVTLELPDNIADQLEAMPPDRRNRYATAAITEKLDAEPPLSQEDLNAIGRGIADVEAGRVVPLEDVIAEMREVIQNRKQS